MNNAAGKIHCSRSWPRRVPNLLPKYTRESPPRSLSASIPEDREESSLGNLANGPVRELRAAAIEAARMGGSPELQSSEGSRQRSRRTSNRSSFVSDFFATRKLENRGELQLLVNPSPSLTPTFLAPQGCLAQCSKIRTNGCQ